MKKKWILTVAAICAVYGLAACGKAEGQPTETDSRPESQVAEQTQTPDSGEMGTSADSQSQNGGSSQDSAYTFTDDLGREVTVGSHERVAVLLGSYADVWLLAGGSICAAPDDAFEDFDLELSEDTVNLGAIRKLSLELLLASEPDFVLASSNTPQNVEWKEPLEGAGIPVAYFDVNGFEDYLRMLKICTDITGQPERYETYGTEVKKRIDQVLERHPKDAIEEPRTALVMRASAASIRAKGNDGNVLGEMLADFGCVNIADTDESLLENLSIESIVLQNPDYVFLVQTGDDEEGIKENIEAMFQENPLWNELDAVKNGQVHIMDKHLYNLKPNARWAEGYEELEKILYPE